MLSIGVMENEDLCATIESFIRNAAGIADAAVDVNIPNDLGDHNNDGNIIHVHVALDVYDHSIGINSTDMPIDLCVSKGMSNFNADFETESGCVKTEINCVDDHMNDICVSNADGDDNDTNGHGNVDVPTDDVYMDISDC